MNGQDIFSCGLFTSYRTVMHDLIEEVAMHMARRAGHRHIAHGSRRSKDASSGHSPNAPNHAPDFTILNIDQGAH